MILTSNQIKQYQKAMLRGGIPMIDSYSILIHQGYNVRNYPNHPLPEGVDAGSSESGCGFCLHVHSNTKLSKPVQIIHLFDGCNDAPIHPANRIIMESGSAAELLICDCTLSGEPNTCSDVTEITLGEGAILNMVRVQNLNSATDLTTGVTVQQAAASQMKTHFVSLNGKIIRNSIHVKLAGKSAEHIACGLSLTKQAEHVDNNIIIVHASPECQSNQLFKQILSDRSTGAFTGRIVVDKNSRKTAAYQRSSNILLHPKAKMNIRPQLEIYADDVKCSHGATVGQLDAEALFYLRSRGISESEATKMLLQAFAGEVLDGISNVTVRESILKLVEDA